MDTSLTPRRRGVLEWITVALGFLGLLVVGWACVTGWGAIVHGHPAYAIWLAVTLVASALTVLVGARGRARRGPWRLALRILALVGGAGWLALTVWLRPYVAVEPALEAMASDSAVSVTETATQIVLAPTADARSTGVFFQPGALVDPRAYAAVLRPLAAAGHTVVIAKQPLGIAFLAADAFDQARAQWDDLDGWVIGGHSLGGTVAALEADASDADAVAPSIGLFFFASYPADDLRASLTIPVLSISGSEDGLATPDKIEASRADLPANAEFVQIEGASHAQFGSYGPQAGDGTPTISDADARARISATTEAFLASIAD